MGAAVASSISYRTVLPNQIEHISDTLAALVLDIDEAPGVDQIDLQDVRICHVDANKELAWRSSRDRYPNAYPRQALGPRKGLTPGMTVSVAEGVPKASDPTSI